MENDVKDILTHYPNARRSDLIALLQDVQEKEGYISEASIKMVGEYLHLPASKIYSLASFYNQFRFEARGKYHIQLCKGINCHLEGSAELIKELKKTLKIREGQTTSNGLFSLEVVNCFGACHIAPVMAVNDTFYPRVNKNQLNEIIEHYTNS